MCFYGRSQTGLVVFAFSRKRKGGEKRGKTKVRLHIKIRFYFCPLANVASIFAIDIKILSSNMLIAVMSLYSNHCYNLFVIFYALSGFCPSVCCFQRGKKGACCVVHIKSRTRNKDDDHIMTTSPSS